MADTYVPFSQPVEYISNDIQQYTPGEVNTTQSYFCPTYYTHCYVCGHGWERGYWKHCGCKPWHPVPVGDGILILVALAMVYVLFKKFKLCPKTK